MPDRINNLLQLIEACALRGDSVTPRYVTDTHGDKWLTVAHSSGEYWFWADGQVMQVL